MAASFAAVIGGPQPPVALVRGAPALQVALRVEGSPQGLTALSQSVCAALTAAGRTLPGTELTPAAVRNLIMEVAARKPYRLSDGECTACCVACDMLCKLYLVGPVGPSACRTLGTDVLQPALVCSRRTGCVEWAMLGISCAGAALARRSSNLEPDTP